jgi:tetratricopeptide (TPR) repeat protein
VAVDPDFALAYARLAEARNELDDAVGANSAMLRALPREGAPKLRRIDALYIDAIHRTLMRDFAGAIRTYSRLAADVPEIEKAAVFVDLGRVREMNQEVLKALEAYREAIRLDRQNAAAHLHAAMLLGRQRQPEEAAEFATAESLYQALSNTEGQVEVLYQRGYLASRPGTLAEARAKLEKAGDLARAISSEQQEIASSLQLAIVAYLEGDPLKAEETAAAAVERARRAGMMYLAARGLTTLGATQVGRRDYDRAEASVQEALAISRRWQMRRAEARALFSLANLHETKGNAELALREIAPALTYFQDSGFKVETILCLTVKVRANRDLGNESDALDGFRKILSLAEAWGDRGQMAIAEQGIALVLLQREEWPQALEHFERYYEISKSLEDREGIGRALLGQANVLWRLGCFPDAERRISEAEALAGSPAGSGSLALIIAERRAGMALSRGRNAEAATLARKVYQAKSSRSTDAELARCLAGLALARGGSAQAGKALCAQSVAAMTAIRDRFSLADTQLALAEILLANGEPSAAAEQVQHSIEVIDAARRPESPWRAWLIAARAYRGDGDAIRSKAAVETARERFADLHQAWPAAYFDSYSTRPDIQSLLVEFRR